ncbi:hypothetical protein Aperf_G00000056114 [Anoplocephala perfoliata]
MGTEAVFYRPRETILNLGLSCLIAGGSFVQSPPSNEACRIPCTASCVSRLIDLRRLRHPNIARYLDAQCDKHRRIYLVTEHYSSDFSQLNPPIKTSSDFNWLLKCFQDCLQGLIYLESNGVVIGSLNPSSLLIDICDNVKITNYGTFYASRWGLDLDFPVVDLRYSSPEALLYSEFCLKQSQDTSSIEPPCPLDSRSDLWSLVLIFTEILHFPLQSFNPKILLRSLLESLNLSHSFFDEVWSALLGLESGYCDDMNRRKIEAALSVASTAKMASTSSSSFSSSQVGLSDQVMGQISVDLPRCHAYDLLIGSPLGQHRLRSVLVAALLANGDRVEYTQGMDSLAAVFTRLCFPDPTSAAHCLSNLLSSPRLINFFARRRFTAGLQAYFRTLLRLLAFHVPAVAAHFARLGVPLTGLTAGWMYTLFAHYMPLDRTEILWDRLLASPSPLPMLVYVAIFHQVNQQCRLLTLNQESICTLLSNFPDFNLDQCLEDALTFAAATPISLTMMAQQELQLQPLCGEDNGDDGRMNHLTRSLHQFNQTHTKMLSKYPESNLIAKHQRGHCLNCLSSWPAHMDVVASYSSSAGEEYPEEPQNHQQTTVSSSGLTFKRSEIDYRRINSSLVALIDPADALQQLSRMDVVLVDMRNKEDYNSGCLMQSIHYSLTEEFEAGVVYLTSSQLWFEATVVRNTTSPRGNPNAHSPGLVMILQRTTNANEFEDTASDLARCLINNAIDRVCVIRGGSRALFSLPQITNYFVSPRT